MAEYHACESRNAYPGEIVLSELGIILRTCQENIDINFQESDFHNYQLLDIFRGRKLNQFNGFRQLNSDKNSRIVVIITLILLGLVVGYLVYTGSQLTPTTTEIVTNYIGGLI